MTDLRLIDFIIWESRESCFPELRDRLLEIRADPSRIHHVNRGERSLGKTVPPSGNAVTFFDLGEENPTDIKLLKQLEEFRKATPLIILVNEKHQEKALSLIRRDAQDYLVKERLDTYIVEKTILFALERFDRQKELKKAEAALKNSEQRFRSLIQDGSDLIAILDPDGSYQYVSPTSSFVLGISPDNFIGKKAFEFIHPEDRERVSVSYEELKTRKRIVLAPYRFQNSEQEWRWIETILVNLTEDPAVGGIVANSRDVTDFLQNEHELKLSNKHLRTAQKIARMGYWVHDLHANKSRWSEELYNIWEQDPEIFKPSFETMLETVHPDDRKYFSVSLDSTFVNDSYYDLEHRIITPSGKIKWVLERLTVQKDENGKPRSLEGIAQDITMSKERERQMKISNDRFEIAMKATNEAIWDWNVETNEVLWSQGFNNLFGYDPSGRQKLEDSWSGRIYPKDRDAVLESLSAAMSDKNREFWQMEYRFIKADKEIAYVFDRGFILRDERGKVIRAVGAILDITDSREKMMEIQRQNKALKEIAWTQSHLVRAPLARVMGLINMLEVGDLGNYSLEELLDYLKISALELDNIVRDIVKKTEVAKRISE